MTPQEEKLILELHSQWGNRWSRIARRLPGRTDNEIKNYWRTYTRKKAQEKKRETSPSSSSTSSASASISCSSSNNQAVNSDSATDTTTESFDSTFIPDKSALQGKKHQKDSGEKEHYSMDDIWKDITSEEPIRPVYDGYCEVSEFSCPPMTSPLWEYSPDTVWRLEGDESKMFYSATDQFVPFYQHENMSLIG